MNGAPACTWWTGSFHAAGELSKTASAGLNEGEDRLTMGCEMLINGKTGRTISFTLSPSVINNHHRMNYPDVRAILVDQDEALRKKYADIVPMLENMAQLQKVLHKSGNAEAPSISNCRNRRCSWMNRNIQWPL